MPVVSGVNTITDGLIFYVDPTNTNTYSGVGTTAYNLIPGGINNFSLVNGVAYDLSNKGYFSFDGSNDYVGLGSTTIFNSTAFTLSFWIKPSSYNGSYVSGAITNGQYTLFGTTSDYQGFTNTFTGAIQFGAAANAIATVNQSNFSTNKWYYYVAVYDSAGTGNSTRFKIYIDSAIKTLTYDAAIPAAPYAAGLEARFGYGPGGRYPYYNGNIGLVQIHNRALSSTEILQNYNATKSRYNNIENIVTDSLVYSLDASNPNSYSGTGTTWYDLSGNNKNFILSGPPTFLKNNSGSLSYSSQYAYASSPVAFTRFTIDCWVKFNAIPVGIYPCVLTQTYPNSTNQLNYALGFCNFTGKFNGGFYDAYGWHCPTGITPVTGVWYHAAVTYDGSAVKFYINGALDSSLSYSGTPYSLGASDWIGRRWDSNEFLNAEIPVVRLYNKALTASEIAQNYNATKSRYINILPPVNDSLVLNLDAGNRASYAGTGTTWFDLTSNRISASLVNGPVFAGTGVSTYFSFDGTNDYVDIPSTSLFNFASGDFSVELAIYYNASTSSDNTYRPAFVLGSGNTYLSLFKWRSGVGNGVYADYSVAGSRHTITTTNSVPSPVVNNTITSPLYDVNGKYTHFVIRVSANVMTLYINSVSYGSVNLASRWNTNLGLRIGTGEGDYMLGLIPYIKFYNRALTAAEILQNFNSVRSRYNI